MRWSGLTWGVALAAGGGGGEQGEEEVQTQAAVSALQGASASRSARFALLHLGWLSCAVPCVALRVSVLSSALLGFALHARLGSPLASLPTRTPQSHPDGVDLEAPTPPSPTLTRLVSGTAMRGLDAFLRALSRGHAQVSRQPPETDNAGFSADTAGVSV